LADALLNRPLTPSDDTPQSTSDRAVDLDERERSGNPCPAGVIELEPSVGLETTAESAALDALAELQLQMNRIQRRVRLELQAQLASFSGRSLGNLKANRELARAIQQLLQTHSLRVRCQQCGHPAILRASPRKGMPGGAFVFDHKIDGKRTFHGGTPVVPTLQLTTQPPRGGHKGGK